MAIRVEYARVYMCAVQCIVVLASRFLQQPNRVLEPLHLFCLVQAQIASSALQVPPEAQRLVFQGRMLNDDTKTLAQNKLKEGSCILLSIAVATSPSLSTSTTSSSGSGAVAAAPPAPPLPSSANAATAAAAAAAAASSAPQVPQAPPVIPPPSTSMALPAHIVILRAAIAGVRTSNPPEVGGTALRTLATMLGNVIANPMEEKYRQLKKNNAAFVRRVGGGKRGSKEGREGGLFLCA